MRHPRIVVSALFLAAIGIAAPSFAAGGAGGGGGANAGGTGGGGVNAGGAGGGGGIPAPKFGAIRTVGGTATCDGSSVLPVVLRKGFNNRIELQITPSGADLGTGRWTVLLHAVDLDQPLGGFGSTLISGSIVTSLEGGVPAGTHTIHFSTQRSTPNDLITDPTSTVLESCGLDLVVVAR